MTPKGIYKAIADQYGIEAMGDIWIEELNELAVALAHHKRGKLGIWHVENEIADVKICIEQMTQMLSDERVIEMNRQRTLLNLPQKLNLPNEATS